MQIQFICYKPKFVNLELRYKCTRVLIRLLVKNTKIKSSRSTQPNGPNTLTFIGLEEINGSIGLEFSQAEHIRLA